MGAVDVTALRVEILDQLGAILPVGAAVLLMLVAIQAFRWIRVALEIDGYERWEDNDDLDDNVFDEPSDEDDQAAFNEWRDRHPGEGEDYQR